MLKCRILTDEFLAKVNKYIKDYLDGKKLEGTEREREAIRRREALNAMWNDPSAYADLPQIKEYYDKLGIHTPEYIEMTFVEAPGPEPSITWVHKTTMIRDIEEIYSYERVD